MTPRLATQPDRRNTGAGPRFNTSTRRQLEVGSWVFRETVDGVDVQQHIVFDDLGRHWSSAHRVRSNEQGASPAALIQRAGQDCEQDGEHVGTVIIDARDADTFPEIRLAVAELGARLRVVPVPGDRTARVALQTWVHGARLRLDGGQALLSDTVVGLLDEFSPSRSFVWGGEA